MTDWRCPGCGHHGGSTIDDFIHTKYTCSGCGYTLVGSHDQVTGALSLMGDHESLVTKHKALQQEVEGLKQRLLKAKDDASMSRFRGE